MSADHANARRQQHPRGRSLTRQSQPPPPPPSLTERDRDRARTVAEVRARVRSYSDNPRSRGSKRERPPSRNASLSPPLPTVAANLPPPPPPPRTLPPPPPPINLEFSPKQESRWTTRSLPQPADVDSAVEVGSPNGEGRIELDTEHNGEENDKDRERLRDRDIMRISRDVNLSYDQVLKDRMHAKVPHTSSKIEYNAEPSRVRPDGHFLIVYSYEYRFVTFVEMSDGITFSTNNKLPSG